VTIQLWVTPDDLEDPTLEDADDACRAASFVLWTLTGRRYGGISTTTELYECPPRLCGDFARPYASGKIRLRRQPVRAITSMTVAGVVIPTTEYALLDNAVVSPTSSATWRTCSGVEITYLHGAQPPEAGKRAAKVLAEELVKARCGDDECRLPDRVTSISRQGVSYTVLDPQDYLENGRVGIYEVDVFIRAINPSNVKRRPKVFTPDLPRASRRS